ncbi:MAG: DUF2259 domain-containing protein [Spirochaetaceae bacterium]|jgi:predicted secreted protein|nr:DUF2259 domain-containing protein [Spirochaetaceae bacterium]
MRRKKPFLFCLAVYFWGAFNLFAGDVANFSDFGFSDDGRFYAFSQYGVYEDSLVPWAELYVVDVARNDFVQGGKIIHKGKNRITAGQDGSDALARAILDNAELAAMFGLDFLGQGTPLYISLENGQNPNGETIEFRDFDNGVSYTAELCPVVYGSGANLKSSFYIILHRDDGAVMNFTVGSPDIKRSRISTYTIKKAFTTPEGKSLIFVIEMMRQRGVGEAPDIRYMVETIKF